MIYCTSILSSLFPLLQIQLDKSDNNLFYIVPLVIIVVMGIFYYKYRKLKRNYSYKNDALLKRFSVLQDQNKSLSTELKTIKKEVTILQKLIEDNENKKSLWREEKENLELEIKELKEQIQKFKKNDDIIIEYYLKDDSSD